MKKFSGGKTLAVVAVAGGAVLASIAPVMADVSAQSPSTAAVRIEPGAKLKAWGAAVEVKVTYACPAGATASINLYVSQSVPIGAVASGNSYKSNLTCSGGFETIALNVPAQNRSFIWGQAFATASLSGWSPSFTASDERTIDIKL